MNKKSTIAAVVYAILAAVFYAISVPCSKMLLPHVPPVFMAAFLYIGAGVGVGCMYIFKYKRETPEQRLSRADLPYTVGKLAALDGDSPRYGIEHNTFIRRRRRIFGRVALCAWRNGVLGLGKQLHPPHFRQKHLSDCHHQRLRVGIWRIGSGICNRRSRF